ncbi:hypothetical protein [Mycobacterium terramassiliense]|uniref:hypothetical protein n=1 Tax=Mycobacterium terramassiliense TaxID=1841859 RepID=UPI0012FF7178|nr:hypothetical protein [Mycobacterium terramassiliense]
MTAVIKPADVQHGDVILAGGETRIKVDRIVRGTLGDVQAALGHKVNKPDDATEQWHYFAAAPVNGKVAHVVVRGSTPVAKVN